MNERADLKGTFPLTFVYSESKRKISGLSPSLGLLFIFLIAVVSTFARLILLTAVLLDLFISRFRLTIG